VSEEALNEIERRIVGALTEKELATPQNCPLSLNALVAACNQKSNRSPVLELEEEDVAKALESLRSKRLVHLVAASESRVPKYRHNFDAHYAVSKGERAALTELLLRGPQTVGELRNRCERMHGFADLEEVRQTLSDLASRSDPLVVELPRRPGQKDKRYAQTLTGPVEEADQSAESGPMKVAVAMTLPPEAEERIAALEAQVAALAEELKAFKAQFD